MSSACSSATRARPAGCLRPSRYPPVCGPAASWPPLRSKRQGRHQRRHPPRASPGISPDRHRGLRVLHRGDSEPVWVSVRLWSSAQDSAKQSCRSGRAPRENRHGESPEGRAIGVGGFRDLEHLLHRAPQPHDSASVCLLASALALPRPWRRPAPQPRRARAVLLQLHPTAPGVAVRARNQDASHAGRSGEHAVGLERHLHSALCHFACVCGGRRNWRGRVADALVAVRTTNGSLINSQRRKHPASRVQCVAQARLALLAQPHRWSQDEAVRSRRSISYGVIHLTPTPMHALGILIFLIEGTDTS